MEIRSLALEDLRVRMALLPQQRRRVLLGYFLSIILQNGMGYTVAMSQIMSFPPYVLAAAWMFERAWVADRYRKRGLIIVFSCA